MESKGRTLSQIKHLNTFVYLRFVGAPTLVSAFVYGVNAKNRFAPPPYDSDTGSSAISPH